MKKIPILLLVGLLASLTARSQSILRFCVMVDTVGKCVKPTNEFDVSSDGGTISLLLTNEKGLNFPKARFKIYYLDTNGNEKLNNIIDHDIQRDWNYIWKDIVFYDAGSYKIKVYSVNSSETFLCSEILKIFTP